MVPTLWPAGRASEAPLLVLPAASAIESGADRLRRRRGGWLSLPSSERPASTAAGRRAPPWREQRASLVRSERTAREARALAALGTPQNRLTPDYRPSGGPLQRRRSREKTRENGGTHEPRIDLPLLHGTTALWPYGTRLMASSTSTGSGLRCVVDALCGRVIDVDGGSGHEASALGDRSPHNPARCWRAPSDGLNRTGLRLAPNKDDRMGEASSEPRGDAVELGEHRARLRRAPRPRGDRECCDTRP
jgi:hypothetical protein